MHAFHDRQLVIAFACLLQGSRTVALGNEAFSCCKELENDDLNVINVFGEDIHKEKWDQNLDLYKRELNHMRDKFCEPDSDVAKWIKCVENCVYGLHLWMATSYRYNNTAVPLSFGLGDSISVSNYPKIALERPSGYDMDVLKENWARLRQQSLVPDCGPFTVATKPQLSAIASSQPHEVALRGMCGDLWAKVLPDGVSNRDFLVLKQLANSGFALGTHHIAVPDGLNRVSRLFGTI